MKQISPSTFRNRITDHFEGLDLDVSCRKKGVGYALYSDDVPLAKLCPTGNADEVEVYSWEDGRWRKVDDILPALPLDDALDHISDHLDDDMDTGGTELPVPILDYCTRVTVHATVGGAVGGVFVHSLAGAAVGAAVAAFCGVSIVHLFRRRFLPALLGMVVVGVPAAAPAAVGGALAAAVRAGIGGGFGGLLCAVVVGGLCASFVFFSRSIAWLLGLFGGVAVGIELVGALNPPSEILRYGIVALVGIGSAKACLSVSGALRDIYQKMESYEPCKQ